VGAVTQPRLPLLLSPGPGAGTVNFQVKQETVPSGAQLHSILGDYDVAYVPSGGNWVTLEVRPGPGNVEPLPSGEVKALAAAHGAQDLTIDEAGSQLRVSVRQVPGGTLVVSTDLSQVTRTVGRIRLIVALGSIAAVLLIALGVFLLLRRGLRPVESMAAQADRITAGDLTERVDPENSRSEVGRLGSALNGMLARIETSVLEREAGQEAVRRFFADASHELRTPLASLRANAELYQQGALPEREQVDEVMRRITLETRRMSNLVDDMLRLARLDQHPDWQHNGRHDPVDLSALIADCVLRAQAADPDRTWHADIAEDLILTGDEELLRRAVDNLLTNVNIHTPEGTAAAVTAAEHDGSLIIEVSDEGPGVPPDKLPFIFDRFYRAATATATAASARPGSGLGLAIVTEVARTHGGTAEATLDESGGLRVTLTIPTVEPAAADDSSAGGRRQPPSAPLTIAAANAATLSGVH